LTADQVDYRVRTGAWVRERPGVFRHCAYPRSREQALVAVVLALGEGTAASHRAAVGLWGVRGYRCSLLEVSQARAAKRIPGVIVHRARDLRPGHVTRVGGVPVTSRVRTLVDLGAVAPDWLVARAMEEWLADRLVSIAQLRDAVAHHSGRGRRGVGVLRRVLEQRVLVDAVADSGVEALLAAVLATRGVPLPAHHHLVDGVAAELDYAYPAQRIAIEVDGYGVHLRSREAFEHDRHRQNELEIAGWRVLRFTSHALRHHPDRVADQVTRMLQTATSPPSPMPL